MRPLVPYFGGKMQLAEQVGTQTGNGAAGTQGRVEVLWSNRPLGAQGVLDFEASAA